MGDKTKTDLTNYSLYNILKDTKHLDTISTCEYISSLVMNMKWYYEKQESESKDILKPSYSSDLVNK
ncbi:hypothetical protein KY313_03030 [Candidatus Woesearchaeota archaeon]|jgi:hypothetical protein|nr:hypothetical protein [Candidatus Woesearchaeota archaeon]